MKLRKIALLSFLLLVAAALAGCLGDEETGEGEEIDPPPDSETVEGNNEQTDESNHQEDKAKKMDTASEENKQTTQTQLYLMDKNGMVAPQVLDLPLPESKEVAAQALKYLIKDGPVSNHLPNGFQAVLPAGTDIIDLNLQEDGTMIVNASKEIENYKPENELEILQAMTYTLTQFDGVNRVQLWVEGQPQEEMPVNGTSIENGQSRADGINIQSPDSGNLVSQEAKTVFYPAMQNDNHYFVPVTKHIQTNEDNKYESLVNTVVEGPKYSNSLMHVFNMDSKLTSEPELNDGVLEVTFNQNVLKDKDANVISDQVMESLVRTLTAQDAIESVSVNVEDVDQVFNENQKAYSEPVTTSAFTSEQKL